jgi:hypothetical protein
MDWIHLAQDKVQWWATGNEPLDYVTGGEFIDYLHDVRLVHSLEIGN